MQAKSLTTTHDLQEQSREKNQINSISFHFQDVAPPKTAKL